MTTYVVMANKGGEAVRFPAYRQAGKSLECRTFEREQTG
jgi:hypothetical protein